LPHNDTFNSYDVGRSPRFFTDWDGSFSIEADTDLGRDDLPSSGENMVLRQQVLQRPIRWHCTDVDPIVLVLEGHQNYAIEVDARIESNTTTSYSSTHVGVCARVRRPYKNWCPAPSGYCFRIGIDGQWHLQVDSNDAKTTTLASGNLPNFDGSRWHRLSLTCNGSSISASIDASLMAYVQDVSLDSGSAALTSGFHYAAFDNFSLRAVKPVESDLVAYSVFTNIDVETKVSGWYGFAFTCNRDFVVTQLARYGAVNGSAAHQLRILEAAGGRVVANGSVDLAIADADSLGFKRAKLKQLVGLVAGRTYYMVSHEIAGGDPFYGLAPSQQCIGSPGPGGTLPRMKVPTDAITILGGVSATDKELNSNSDPWKVLSDYEPRSFGPVSFAFDDSQIAV